MGTLSSYSVLTQCPRLECCAGFSRQTTGPDVFGSALLRISHVVQVSPGQLWCRFQWRKTLATGRGGLSIMQTSAKWASVALQQSRQMSKSKKAVPRRPAKPFVEGRQGNYIYVMESR